MSLIIDHYQKDERVNGKKVGMTGTSQGGCVTFITMTKDNRITAAAPLIARRIWRTSTATARIGLAE